MAWHPRFYSMSGGVPFLLTALQVWFLLAVHVLFCSACMHWVLLLFLKKSSTFRAVCGLFLECSSPCCTACSYFSKVCALLLECPSPFRHLDLSPCAKTTMCSCGTRAAIILGSLSVRKKDMFMQKHCCGEQTWTERDVHVKRLRAAPR